MHIPKYLNFKAFCHVRVEFVFLLHIKTHCWHISLIIYILTSILYYYKYQGNHLIVEHNIIMSPIMLFSIIFFLCSFSCFPLNIGAADSKSIYESFLQCLTLQPPQHVPTFSTIVYSSAFNSTSYTTVLQEYIKNRRFNSTSTPKPVLIITPTKESHVQATIICAKKLGVQIKIRSGGHDYEGISYISSEKDFIVLDMFNFRDVNVNHY